MIHSPTNSSPRAASRIGFKHLLNFTGRDNVSTATSFTVNIRKSKWKATFGKQALKNKNENKSLIYAKFF